MNALLFIALATFGEPSLTWTPEAPRPGDLVRVRLASSATAATAELGGLRYPLVFGRVWEGYLAVPIEAAVELELRVLTPDGPYRATVPLTAREWSTTELKVGKRFTRKVHPPRVQARLTRERAAIASVWAAPPTPLASTKRAVHPTRSRRRTGHYGTRRVFNGELRNRHYGVDLAGGVGAPVRAVWPGRVVMASDRYYSGGTLVLDHGGGLFTLYFHLSERRVKRGQTVKAGTRIGAVGKSGRVTGPHLHLSVGVRAEPGEGPPRIMYVDPEPVLAGVFAEPESSPGEQGPLPRVGLGQRDLP